MQIERAKFEDLKNLVKERLRSSGASATPTKELEVRYTQPLQRQRFLDVLRYYNTVISSSSRTAVSASAALSRVSGETEATTTLREKCTLEISINTSSSSSPENGTGISSDAYRVEFPCGENSNYCSFPTERISQLPMLQKKRVLVPVDFDEYNVRVNLKSEVAVPDNTTALRSIVHNILLSNDTLKVARLKRRFFAIDPHHPELRYDFTNVKQVTTRAAYGSPGFMLALNRSIESYETEIEYIGERAEKPAKFTEPDDAYIAATSMRILGATNLLLKVILDVDHVLPVSTVKSILSEYAGLVGVEHAFKAAQKREEGHRMISQQGGGDGSFRGTYGLGKDGKPGKKSPVQEQHVPFIGPKPVTLTKENVMLPPVPGVISVLKQYTITEKADGERRLLFVARDKKVYTIDDRMNVSFTGLESNGPVHSILDGEYIPAKKLQTSSSIVETRASSSPPRQEGDVEPKNKMSGKKKNTPKNKHGGGAPAVPHADDDDSRDNARTAMFTCFDIYFAGGKDVRTLPLLSSNALTGGGREPDRLALADRVVEDGFSKMSPSDCTVSVKRFYTVNSQAEMFARANTVFRERDAGLFPYEIDGLIFTPALEPVGGKERAALPAAASGGTWKNVLKWKPPEMNTIDFLVRYHNDDLITGDASHDSGSVYRVIDLYVGRSVSTKPLSMFDVLSDGTFAQDRPVSFNKERERIEKQKAYVAVKFQPDDETRVTHKAYLKLDAEGRAFAGQDEIMDSMIVEFAYDTTGLISRSRSEEDRRIISLENDIPFRWTPIRIRHDKTQRFHASGGMIGKTANDHSTAQHIWTSIHDPVTEEMLRGLDTGALRSNISSMDMRNQSMYYLRNKARNERASLPMLDFHNAWVKERHLLGSFSGNVTSLFDVGSGEGGDIQKWRRMEGLKRVVGIDYDRHNIVNPSSGAYSRLLRPMGRNNNNTSNPMIVFFPMDASKPFDRDAVSSMPDEKDRAVGNMIWGFDRHPQLPSRIFEVAAKPFDLVSCQFTIHYFFENMTSLRTFARNVASVLREGGYVIGTCLDGEKVDRELAKISKHADAPYDVASVTTFSDNEEGRNKTKTADNFDPPTNTSFSPSIRGETDDGNLMWHIQKMYSGRLLDKKSEDRIGQKIRVFIESIGHAIDEYLVDFDLLTSVMSEVGLRPVSESCLRLLGLDTHTGLFDQLFQDMRDHVADKGVSDSDPRLVNGLSMMDVHKRYSFLNRWFVFQKQSE